MGILELIAGIIIGISIGSFDREPVLPNDSTRVSQAYHNIYYDVHFRSAYHDPSWSAGYYYPYTTYYVDTPRYVYVKSKKKRSGEYRRTRGNNGGSKGGYRGGGSKGGNTGGKSRGGRRATRRE
jgi:uncharacterized membrane protein YgcG|tara:strand:- start:6 stop:377 length:372 start_codon:yes stop_codon:yes gene_type:complete